MTGEKSAASEAYAPQFIEDLRVLLLQPAGRRFLRGLFEHLGLFRACKAPGAEIHSRTQQHADALWLMGAFMRIRPGLPPDVLGDLIFGNDGEYDRLLEEERRDE